jgi:hypothetical protein
VNKGRAIAFVALTAAITAAFLYRPSSNAPPVCMSKRMLGVSCPGCGMTRSVTAAARGDLASALRFHAFGPLLLAGALAVWALLAVALAGDRRTLPDLSRPFWTYVVVGFFAALVVYWLARLAMGATP